MLYDTVKALVEERKHKGMPNVSLYLNNHIKNT